MPEQVQADLDRRVAALVEARRDQLAELVRDAVDQELERLVDAEIRSRNGAGGVSRGIPDIAREAGDSTSEIESPALALRRCNRCERDLPASSFERHRNVCRECRRQEARAREHRATTTEPPRPDA